MDYGERVRFKNSKILKQIAWISDPDFFLGHYLRRILFFKLIISETKKRSF